MASGIERLSCGAVIVRPVDGAWLTPMLRAYRNWDFPKGASEEGEEPLQTTVREVREETGIADLQFRWGERFFDTGPYNRGKVARYYLAETATEEVHMGISPELGRPEHHEFRWLSFDEAHDISSPRVRLVINWARQIIGC